MHSDNDEQGMEVRLSWVTDSGISGFLSRRAEGFDESAVWKAVGESLSAVTWPCKLNVICMAGTACLDIVQRGTYFSNGIEMPSMHVTEVSCNMKLPSSMYRERYLTCLNEESVGGHGSYKYYRMIPEERTGTMDAEYGRIAEKNGPNRPRRLRKHPAIHMYWVTYYEKLSKGYVDMSDVYLASERDDLLLIGLTEHKVTCLEAGRLGSLKALCNATRSDLLAIRGIGPHAADVISAKLHAAGLSLADGEQSGETGAVRPDPVSASLYDDLMARARHLVAESLSVGVDEITSTQVVKSRGLIDELREETDVDAFNAILKVLLQVAPRPLGYVSTAFATSSCDFGRILQRESDLADAMATVVVGRNVAERLREKAAGASFSDYGIGVRLATPEEEKQVVDMLDSGLKLKVLKVYRMDPADQKRRFDDYCRRRGITDIRHLWHGSRSENWASIVLNSLQLNPDAKVTGKMFGYGIYTAPSARKSYLYTDGHFWAGGAKSPSVYLGVYACAYGKPLDPSTDSGRHIYDQETLTERGYDCVHASRGAYGLHNDEVVFYDEAALVMEYLVELAA